jgi:hypothetical protein
MLPLEGKDALLRRFFLEQAKSDRAQFGLSFLVLCVVRREELPDERVIGDVPAFEPARPTRRSSLLCSKLDRRIPGEEIIRERSPAENTRDFEQVDTLRL